LRCRGKSVRLRKNHKTSSALSRKEEGSRREKRVKHLSAWLSLKIAAKAVEASFRQYAGRGAGGTEGIPMASASCLAGKKGNPPAFGLTAKGKRERGGSKSKQLSPNDPRAGVRGFVPPRERAACSRDKKKEGIEPPRSLSRSSRRPKEKLRKGKREEERTSSRRMSDDQQGEALSAERSPTRLQKGEQEVLFVSRPRS